MEGYALYHSIAVGQSPRSLMGDIVGPIARSHGVSVEALRGPSRLRHIVVARHEAMAALRATGRYSYPRIGKFFGGRDHTTVIYGERRHHARALAEQVGA